MGWSHGIDERRDEGDQDIGYSVESICDEERCNSTIHRGLAYVCGGNPYGDPHGCGKFFCFSHLDYYFNEDDGMSPQLCKRCGEIWNIKNKCSKNSL